MPANDQGAAQAQGRYLLIPHTLVFLHRGEHILLLRGATTKRLWSGLLNGIGGHVERGEDPLSAARRELREETGLESVDLALVGVLIVDTQISPGVGIFVFWGTAGPGEVKPSDEGSLHWFRLDELAGQAVVPDLPVLLAKIQARKPGDPPFAGYSFYDEAGRQQTIFQG